MLPNSMLIDDLRKTKRVIRNALREYLIFKNLVPIIENKYVDFNTFQTSNPLLTELYSRA